MTVLRIIAIMALMVSLASADTFVGYVGGNNGKITGSIGLINGGSTPPPSCTGTIDTSTGCVLPMLGH